MTAAKRYQRALSIMLARMNKKSCLTVFFVLSSGALKSCGRGGNGSLEHDRRRYPTHDQHGRTTTTPGHYLLSLYIYRLQSTKDRQHQGGRGG